MGHRSPVIGTLVPAALLAIAGCGSPEPPSETDAASSRPDAASEAADASAETPLEPPDPPEPQEGELLLASPPEGWRETGAMKTPSLRMAEYGPPAPPEGTLERLTFEAEATKPLPDPIDFVLSVSRALASRCQGFDDTNISSGHENGYPTSVRLMICPKFTDSPHGQVVIAKAIQGNDKFYVITRRLQVPPMEGDGQPLTAQAMAEWTAHLKGAQVCDTRSDEHPCPASVAGNSGKPDANAPEATPE